MKMPSVSVPPMSISAVSTMASWLGCLDCPDEFFRANRPAKEILYIEERRFMQRRRTRRHGAIRDEDRPVILEIGVPQCGLYTNVCRDARKKEIPDAPRPQLRIERRPGKPAVPRLDYHQIPGLWLQFLHDGKIPGAFRQQLPLQFRLAIHQVHRQLFMPIRGIRPPAIAQVRFVPHLNVYDWNARLPRRMHYGFDGADYARCIGNIRARDIQHPALRSKRILHVHDNDRGLRQLHLDRPRLGIQLRHRILSLCRSTKTLLVNPSSSRTKMSFSFLIEN